MVAQTTATPPLAPPSQTARAHASTLTRTKATAARVEPLAQQARNVCRANAWRAVALKSSGATTYVGQSRVTPPTAGLVGAPALKGNFAIKANARAYVRDNCVRALRAISFVFTRRVALPTVALVVMPAIQPKSAKPARV